MSNRFDGFVLRKPKIASANSTSTSSEPNTLVLDRDSNGSGLSDRDEYISTFIDDETDPVEFLIVPAFTGNLIEAGGNGQDPLKVFYTRNDSIERFSWDNAERRWKPKPGSSPDLLGELPGDGSSLELTTVEDDLGTPRIVIGSLSENPVPVSWEYDEQNWPPPAPSSIPAGEAIAFVETGEILFASDIVANKAGLPVYQFRENFFQREDVTGVIGIAGGDEDLYLNPIPKADERPLIRSKYGSYLDPSSDISWDLNSGELTFLTSDYDGEPIYYDGVYNTLNPVGTYGPTDLGTINEPLIFTTPVEFNIPSDYDREGMIIYVKESGVILSDIVEVDEFSRPHTIPEGRAELKIDGSTKTIRLASTFVTNNDDNTLAVGTGDFYLENGITFRLQPSPLDPSNEDGIPDARNSIQIENETISDSIAAGPFTGIPQIPLQDIEGYGPNTFFRLEDGARRKILEPNRDVVYDFDSRQIRWASPIQNEVHTIRKEISSVKLDSEILLASDFEFYLEEDGSSQLLEPGQDVLVDFDGGQIFFSEARGRLLYEGVGSFQENGNILESTNTEFDFDPISTDPLKQPLLIVGSSVRRITDFTSSTLICDQDYLFEDNEEGVPFQVISPSEVVFSSSLQTLDLNRRWIFPEIVIPIEDGDHIPDGESFSFVERDGSQDIEVDYHLLEPEKLGTLSNGSGQDPLEIPAYYLPSQASYTLLRGNQSLTQTSSPTPSEGEFYVDSQGVLTFNEDDVEEFEDSDIILDPSFSSNHPQGLIEVLNEDRSIQIPSSITEDISVIVLLAEDQYNVQKANGSIFFNERMREGVSLRVRYFQDEDTEIIEDVGFRRKETLSLGPNQTSANFGSGFDLDTQRDVILYVNGSPVSSSYNDANGGGGGGGTITFSPIPDNRLVQVSYHVKQAGGGEKLARLLKTPFAPEMTLEEGNDPQVFYGDHVAKLSEDTVIFVDGAGFRVNSTPSYDASSDTTSVSLFPSPSQTFQGPTIEGTTDPITEYESLPSLVMDDNNKDASELRFFGDVSEILKENHILTLDGAPYRIDSINFEEDKGLSLVTLKGSLSREYKDPQIEQSKYTVYGPEPAILNTQLLPFTTEPHYFIRFDSEGKGHLLEENVNYRLINNGSCVLDPVETDLPEAGEVWHLGYLGRKEVSPKKLGGSSQRIFPRVIANYTRFISASSDNGIEGSSLVASYSFRSPDSFYFRALPLEDFSFEVASDLETNVNALSPSGGPTLSFGTSLRNYEQGSETLVGEGSDLKDRDRVARRFIQFYNEIAQKIEAYFQALDGRVVGDRDGQFSFFIDDYGQRGGEDEVTGELTPYYANPDGSGERPDSDTIQELDILGQKSFVRNSIDDRVLVSKKPYQLGDLFSTPPLFSFEGTFKKAWEPHRISRFYPQLTNVATVTPPSLGGSGSDYTFLNDFNEILGDLGVDNVLSITELTERPARGWLIDGDVEEVGSTDVQLRVGMSFPLGESQASNTLVSESPPNLEDGDPDRLIPGFRKGQVVNLGRVNFTKDPVTGEVTRTFDIYAENMEIAEDVNATSDYIVLTEADSIDIGGQTFDLEGTDPLDLINDPSKQPQKNDTLFVQSTKYFRQNFDYGLEASEGDLLNATLPDFLATIIDQNSPDPLTFLDATIVHKNQRVEPYRFPALDGEPTDDDDLTGLPYAYPLNDSEIVSFQDVLESVDNVEISTEEGIVGEADLIDGFIFRFGSPLLNSDNNAPIRYNEVLIEGESETFQVSEVQNNDEDLILAAFQVEENALAYDVENAFEGDGQRDSGNAARWNDLDNFDFSGVDGITGTLQIGTSTYAITTFGNGYVEVNSPISEDVGSFPYTIDIEGVGNIQGDLHSIKDNYDFSGMGGDLVLAGSPYNSGTYEIAYGGVGEFSVLPANLDLNAIGVFPRPVAILVTSSIIESGLAYVGLGAGQEDFLFLEDDPQTLDLSQGDFLQIPSGSPNGGLYEILEIGPNFVVVDQQFRIEEGSSTNYSVNWTTYVRPRRFSDELEDLRDAMLEQRVIYQNNAEAPSDIEPLLVGIESSNPSTPSLDILSGLIEEMFGQPFTEGGDGEIIGSDLESLSSDFSQLDEENAYVLIESGGESQGFYRVTTKSVNTLELVSGSFFQNGSLSNEQGLDFTIYEGSMFSERTYELILHEYYNVLDLLDLIDAAIRVTFHDQDELLSSDPLIDRPGDPENSLLNLYFTSIEDRRDWIVDDSPSLREELEAVLKGSEALYDLRYSWIDYRINLEDGLLPAISRFKQDLEKRKRKRRRELLKINSM